MIKLIKILNENDNGTNDELVHKNDHKSSYHHYLVTEVFNEGESSSGDDRESVLKLIHENKLQTNDAKLFHDSLGKSKHILMLSHYSVNDFKKMKLFKVLGYDIGYALKMFGDKGYKEIVALYNNEPTIKGIGEEIVRSAIKNGGCYLDHFSGFLDGLYSKLGFVEYKRDKFDPSYFSDDTFERKYGKADVVYRKYEGCK